MFIRVLKKCRCTLSYWHDRHCWDRWKDDAWEKRKRQETLEEDQVIEGVVRVRPSSKRPGRCQIEVVFMADMRNRYVGVPLHCIEILEGKPAATASEIPRSPAGNKSVV